MNEQYKKFAEQCWDYDHNGMSTFDTMKFAHLVAHHEREACANIAFSMTMGSEVVYALVDAITSRGKVK